MPHPGWALLAAAAVAGGATDLPKSRPATPIYRSVLANPLEAAGTGLAPTVSVRMSVDARGKVRDVEIVRIRPSSRLDGAFTERVREALGAWRFAPARDEEGRPVATQLSLDVQFLPTAADSSGGGVLERNLPFIATPLGRRLTAEEWWDVRVAEMSPKELEEALDRHAATAEKHLTPESRREATVQRMTAVTDAPSEGVPERILQNIRATFGAIRNLVGGSVPPEEDDRELRAYVFTRETAFHKFTSEVGAGHGMAGVWIPTGILAVHLQLPSNEELRSVLLHEAAHAFLSRHLIRRGSPLPTWFGEGFAEYIGNSEVKDGKLVAGARSRYQIHRAPGAIWRGKSASQDSLERVRRALADENTVPLADLMSAPHEGFYEPEFASLRYAQAWLLVHFLRHGREGWAEREFPEFLLYVVEGFPVAAALHQVYGLEGARLEKEWRAYVSKL